MAEHAHITLDLGEHAAEFLSLIRSVHERLDEHERQVKELYRRLHSLNEMIEERDQH